MTDATAEQTRSRGYQKHGHYRRIRWLRKRGLNAINGRTIAGKEALRWKAWALGKKGDAYRLDIELAAVDLWLTLELAVFNDRLRGRKKSKD